ncbi:hypothetical protein HY498_02665 [Candidatus Woesearchaeota archaeon]|nr:hypothetical protein [Candidatus Woesearchaeota archaeon]
MTEKEKLKEAYEILRKKYNLPNFNDLNNEFEISSIKKPSIEFLLRVIRRRITDKLAMFCNILQALIMPNTGSAVNLHEIKFFTEEDRVKIEKLLSDMMYLERKSLLLDINSKENVEAEFLKTTMEYWPRFSLEMMRIVDKMSSGWKTEEKTDKTQYFG